MKSAMHSGEGSGAVASSFRVLRQLLDRIEDPATGEIKLPELNHPIPPRIYEAVAKTVETIGAEKYLSGFSKHEQTKFVSENVVENYLNGNFRPTLCIVGMAGLPDMANAGNVLRTHTEAKVSIRIPPGVDVSTAEDAVERAFTRDPPYNAVITVEKEAGGPGFLTP